VHRDHAILARRAPWIQGRGPLIRVDRAEGAVYAGAMTSRVITFWWPS